MNHIISMRQDGYRADFIARKLNVPVSEVRSVWARYVWRQAEPKRDTRGRFRRAER